MKASEYRKIMPRKIRALLLDLEKADSKIVVEKEATGILSMILGSNHDFRQAQ
ncbi:hypothetical protein [Chromatium okenii]|uniref:hypothetical protein n=1 Tax=Chromatium okenii TaxID=61644 RepID=UPI001F5B87C4|nr:hypothetical protein [Chromatium okenii]